MKCVSISSVLCSIKTQGYRRRRRRRRPVSKLTGRRSQLQVPLVLCVPNFIFSPGGIDPSPGTYKKFDPFSFLTDVSKTFFLSPLRFGVFLPKGGRNGQQHGCPLAVPARGQHHRSAQRPWVSYNNLLTFLFKLSLRSSTFFFFFDFPP